MEFFGFTLFGSLTGGALVAVAAVIYTTALFLCRSQELREAIDYVKSRKTSK